MRDKYQGSVGAKATVTLELTGLGAWGTGYTMEQIIDQAAAAATSTIRRAFQNEPGVRIVGDPEVTAVYAPATKVQAR